MTAASPDLETFIRTRFHLAPVPAIPELSLYSAGPASGLGRFQAARGRADHSPYWAHRWAGGLVMARYILDNPATVRDKRVLDYGAGSGLIGIAAARAGASHVAATDIDEDALVAMQVNAEANGVAVEPVPVGRLEAALSACDIVLAGDVFYLPKAATASLEFFAGCSARGLEILIGDPGRRYLPRDLLQELALIAVPDFGEAESKSLSAVYRFRGQALSDC